MEYDYKFTFRNNLKINKKTYEMIGSLYKLLFSHKNKKILIDMSNVSFISGDLFAVLGACLTSTVPQNNHEVVFRNIQPAIKSLMVGNSFGRYFNFNSPDDKLNNCIEYAVFQAKTEQLEKFEKHVMLQIFTHEEISEMTSTLRNRITDYFLEIFNNVIDHTDAKYVYVCGQFFKKSKSFVFSIVDMGVTISEKISQYCKKYNKEIPNKSIEWAIKSGNTTKVNSPGGLGFATLLDFLAPNEGKLTIVSQNEYFEFNNRGCRTLKLNNCFPGTVVTISVNLNDNKLYILDVENDEKIEF